MRRTRASGFQHFIKSETHKRTGECKKRQAELKHKQRMPELGRRIHRACLNSKMSRENESYESGTKREEEKKEKEGKQEAEEKQRKKNHD